jgi:putrescine aminotransferase
LFASSLTGMDLFRTQFGLSVGDRVHLADSTSWHSSGQGGSMEEFCQHLIRSLDAQILRIGPENIAAFVGDPIQTAGVIIPPDNYWQEVRRICDLYDILIVADEAITGFGKTGRMFGFENFNYEPDLIVMAKGISSGYFPISAVALGGRVANVLQNSDEILAHSFTNSGHPVGAAVALESIAIIEEDGLLRRVREEVGPYFAERLGELRRYPCIGDVRSIGILGGFSIDLSKVEVAAAADGNFYERVLSIAWRHGLAIRGTGSICLPMIVTKKQIDEIIDILKASIDEASLRCAAERPA